MKTILIRTNVAVIFSFLVYMRYIIGPGVSRTLPDHPSCVPMMEYECCGAGGDSWRAPEAQRGREPSHSPPQASRASRIP